MLEEKIYQFLTDTAFFLPQTIIDWFNLTDANILHLQYISLVLPLIAFALNLYSKVIFNGYTNGGALAFNIIKFAFITVVIIGYDEVIRTHLPLSIREAFNNEILLAEYFLSFALFLIELLLVVFLMDFLSMLHSAISLIVFKKSKRIRIGSNVCDLIPEDVYFKVGVSSLTLVLPGLLNAAAVMFYAVVLYYNYCI